MKYNKPYFNASICIVLFLMCKGLQAQPVTNRFAKSYDTIVKQSGNKKELTVINSE